MKGPQLVDTFGPDWVVRRRRRRRLPPQDDQPQDWRLRFLHPVDRRELVNLLERRFPYFAIDLLEDRP